MLVLPALERSPIASTLLLRFDAIYRVSCLVLSLCRYVYLRLGHEVLDPYSDLQVSYLDDLRVTFVPVINLPCSIYSSSDNFTIVWYSRTSLGTF